MAETPSPAPAPPMRADARTEAELRRLETRWGEAFVARDFEFLERIIAPEFRLVSTTIGGQTSITSRADWMRNSRAMLHLGFTGEVFDVVTAGDTAVVSLRSAWTRKGFSDRPAVTTYGYLTDTWVRRGGRWQVINRFSQRRPPPGTPAPPAKPAE